MCCCTDNKSITLTMLLNHVPSNYKCEQIIPLHAYTMMCKRPLDQQTVGLRLEYCLCELRVIATVIQYFQGRKL